MAPSSQARRRRFGIVAGLVLGAAGWREVTPAAPPTPWAAETAPKAAPESSRAAPSLPALPAPSASAVATPSATAPRPLFEFVEAADAAGLSAALPAPSPEIHYVRIDPALVTGKASPFWRPAGDGRLHVPLPRGGAITVVIESTELLEPGRFTATGSIEGRSGSRAIFAATGPFLHATIEDPVLGTFTLRVATEELSQFYRIDPALVAPCGGTKRPHDLPFRSTAAAPTIPGEIIAAVAAASPGQGSSVVHVMMAHSNAVLTTMSGAARRAALQSAFDAAIARVNVIFAASLVTTRVRLVHVHETTYNENLSAGNKVQDEALTAIQARDDGVMDDIHAVRNAVGADIVCLALQRSDFASSGLSFLLTPDRVDNDDYAYSVIHYGSIAGTNVVAHELGHVLGCAHDRQNAQGSNGAFAYSYGYRFVGADGRQYRDIMAYPPGTELGYFSNPDVALPSPVNAALGIPAGRTGESNTARTIEQMSFLTASYRLQTQTPPNPGVLINVATRAWIGEGEQVLIGGFVIGGTQTKRVLIRGAGPSLQAFGVTNALANPVLRVFAGPTLRAENDNWNGDANIRTASSEVGAFPFTDKSADAAVLISLTPGAYTAVLEGVTGTTGSGLIEVYDADRTANKIVNLSTRGYADRNGREMHGGFVVEGPPGQTKRILVRVLGPSLSRPPFNLTSTLPDPMLELRAANGELLLTNDDWSAESDRSTGVKNEFRPLARSYGERQIFATGYAPGNRREPCILVDLPPGNYGVVVKPFEERSSVALLDQPAEPGVGIVEVYEINP